MSDYSVRPIGYVRVDDEGFRIELLPDYIPALTGLEGFSNIQMLWWFDGCDNASSRGKLTEHKPYTNGPETLGTFATRSPERPNPIALSCVSVVGMDCKAGRLWLAYTDANDGSPVLDIKPYTPSLDRVEAPEVPDWCADWPNSVEESGDFDWDSVFAF